MARKRQWRFSVGKPDDAALYSRSDNQRFYNSNVSLDTAINGNHGNNDGVIQKKRTFVSFIRFNE